MDMYNVMHMYDVYVHMDNCIILRVLTSHPVLAVLSVEPQPVPISKRLR